MIGMSFASFVLLTVIGGVVACVYHFGFRYRLLGGAAAIFGKLVIGWIGAWLGSPVLGHWWWKVENIYVVPAILGAIAAIHLNCLAGMWLMKLAGIEREKEQVKPMKAAA